MSKQTLQQKIQRALARFTPRRIAIIMLGTAILSFGIHNIHQRTAITEGGIIGLVLLINHWLGVPASVAKPDCMVQHPLPAHRGEEIAPDVLEGHREEIFDEAENRIYVEKAVLAILLAGK